MSRTSAALLAVTLLASLLAVTTTARACHKVGGGIMVIMGVSQAQQVQGTVRVSALPIKEITLVRVQLQVDGNALATDTTDPFDFDWDTTKLENGGHSLMMRAFDNNDGYTDSDAVVVTVAN